MRRKTAHEDCNINKISKHLPIDLKFSGYILEHMGYDIAKTKLFGFTWLLRYKDNKKHLSSGWSILTPTVNKIKSLFNHTKT